MTQFSSDDTIFALSSGRGRAGVAVVRISGPASRPALERLAGPVRRRKEATLRRLHDPRTGEPLDDALVLFFEAPASFTGEDVVELHVHGGPAVVEGVLEALSHIGGMRGAEAGEFARRAFENGKLDLTQVEGLADLIEAETTAQRRQALGQSGGALRDLCVEWRDQIIHAASLLEAALDFSDEADIPELVEQKARPVIARLLTALSSHLDSARRGERLRDGFRVVLAGPPNAGKSTLLNALAERDVAIVSHEPGTTRDTIEVHLDLAGYPVTLIDTAGLREASGEVEREGIRRTFERIEDADFALWLVDATAPQWEPPDNIRGVDVQIVSVLNKVDLEDANAARQQDTIAISAKTGEALESLISVLASYAAESMSVGEPAVVTRQRQRRELETCRDALREFMTGDPLTVELRAEELRVAARALGRLSGRVDVEDILDRIFGDFCIGK